MEKKKKSKWKIVGIIFLVLQFIAEVMAVVELAILNMLPTRYFVVIIVALVWAMIISAAMVLLPGPKSKMLYVRRGIGLGLSIVILIGSTLVALAVGKANHTVSVITDDSATSSLVGVYVMDSDPAETIEDAKDYTFGYTKQTDYDNTKIAIEQIEKELGSKINLVEYDNVTDIADALYAEKVDAMIINVSFGAILENQDKYFNFQEVTKLIYQYEIITEVEKEDVEEDLGPITERPFVVYISGSDLETKKLAKTRSDVNILAVVNPTTKQVLLVNTPRDTYVPCPASKTKDMDKLTHVGLYGVDCSMEALSELYDVDVEYYTQVNFRGFKTLIDAVGGVTVYSEKSFTTSDGLYSFHKGENYVDGEYALGFVRERDAFGDGDFQRGRDQMKVVKALIEKASDSKAILTGYSDILDGLGETFMTNVSSDEMSELAKMQLDDMSGWDVYSYTLMGEGASKTTYTVPNQRAYVMIKDEESLKQAKKLIQKVYNGEYLTEEDVEQKE